MTFKLKTGLINTRQRGLKRKQHHLSELRVFVPVLVQQRLSKLGTQSWVRSGYGRARYPKLKPKPRDSGHRVLATPGEPQQVPLAQLKHGSGPSPDEPRDAGPARPGRSLTFLLHSPGPSRSSWLRIPPRRRSRSSAAQLLRLLRLIWGGARQFWQCLLRVWLALLWSPLLLWVNGGQVHLERGS